MTDPQDAPVESVAIDDAATEEMQIALAEHGDAVDAMSGLLIAIDECRARLESLEAARRVVVERVRTAQAAMSTAARTLLR